MKRILTWIVMLCALAGLRCSVVDGGDRQELENRLSAASGPDLATLRAWLANRLYWDFFQSKARNLKIGDVRCTNEMSDDEEVETDPSKWSTAGEITVMDMLRCIGANLTASYEDCLITISGQIGDAAGFTGDKRGCYPRLYPAWETEVVNAEILGESTTNSNRLADRLTIGQMADALIKSAAPPPLPGFAVGGAFVELLPILCMLSAGDSWGCPDSPLYPGGGDKP